MKLELSFAGSPLSVEFDPISGRRLPLTDASAAALHPDLVPYAADFAENHLYRRRTDDFLREVWLRLGFSIYDAVDITVTKEQMSEWGVTREDIERSISFKQAKVASTTIFDDKVRFQSTGFDPATDGLPIELRG